MGQGDDERGWRQGGDGEEGRKERGGSGSGIEASGSKGFLVPRGACCFGVVPVCGDEQIASTCKVAPVGMPQVSLAEASRPPQAGLLGPPQPPPILCWVRTSGPGLDPEASALSLGLLSCLGVGGCSAHVHWSWDSDQRLLASRPLAKALLLFLRKMQQESSLLLQSAKGPLEVGLRFPGLRQARPDQANMLSAQLCGCPSEQPRSGHPSTSCRSQNSARGGVTAADRGPQLDWGAHRGGAPSKASPSQMHLYHWIFSTI